MTITILGTDHRYEQHARYVEDRVRRYEPDQVFREGFRDMQPDEIRAEYADHLQAVEDIEDEITDLPRTYDEDVNDPDVLQPQDPDELGQARPYDLHPAALEHNGVLDEVAERKRSPSNTETYRVLSAAEETGSELHGCDMDLPALFEGEEPEKVIDRLTDPRFNRRREDRMVETIDAAYTGGDALAILGSTHVDNVAADLERAGYDVEKGVLPDDHRVQTDVDAYTEYVIGRILDG